MEKIILVFFFTQVTFFALSQNFYSKVDTLDICYKDSIKTKCFNLKDNTALYKINDTTFYRYQKPKLLTIFTNPFRNLYEAPKIAFSGTKENLITWGIIAVSTGLTYYYDTKILYATQKFGNWLGIRGEDNRQKNIFLEKLPINIPDDFGFSLYFVGDGITEMGINACFYAYGYSKKDIRAMRVANELTEGLAAVGIVIQILKRSTGRNSPFTVHKSDNEGDIENAKIKYNTQRPNNEQIQSVIPKNDIRERVNRGTWELFPSKYNSAVPHYDAFPSGHLATAMMTVTIISENYPEYEFIKPIGYGLMTILGFQMLNNGVHWASDYPLAIGIGYTVGKIAVVRGRNKAYFKDYRSKSETSFWDNFIIVPAFMPSNGLGVGAIYRF